MSDVRQYTVWPSPRSRSRSFQSWKSGHFHFPLIPKLGHNIKIWSGWNFYICPNFCITWLWSWHKLQLWSVDRQSRTGLIYLDVVLACTVSLRDILLRICNLLTYLSGLFVCRWLGLQWSPWWCQHAVRASCCYTVRWRRHEIHVYWRFSAGDSGLLEEPTQIWEATGSGWFHILLLARLFDRVSWPNKARPSMNPFVLPSVHKKLIWFQWNLACKLRSTSDAWRIQCDPIQGQGHQPFRVGNPARLFLEPISSTIYNGSWLLTTDS